MKYKFFASFLLIFSIVVMPIAPVFAQVGDLTPTPPAPSVAPAPAPSTPPISPTPPAEPTPVVVTPPAPSTPPPIVTTPPPTVTTNTSQTSEATVQAVNTTVTQVITPPADTTGPVIAGVANLSLATHDATIVWTTDELSVSTFEYGTTQSYGSSPTIDTSSLLAHTAILTNLNPGTTYYYCIHARDLAQNLSNSCGHTFTTASQTVVTDSTPPNVSVITVAPITTTGATINFTTDEIGNSRIEYGTDAGYGQGTNLNTTLSLNHSVALSSLTPNTLYHYRIITSDEIGNETITSDETFTTLALSNVGVTSGTSETTTITTVPVQPTQPTQPVQLIQPTQPVQVTIQTPSDTTAPVISGIGTASLGITDATLAWSTNELANSTLEYGTNQNYGTHATIPLSALLSHSATLTGLSPNTTYYYCIHATDLSQNSSNSCPHSFTTDAAPVTIPQTPTDTTAPQISLITVVPIATSTATIGWTTNELATSSLQYGLTTNYGSTVYLAGASALTHSTSLSGLQPNTTYHFRIISTDAAGNTQMSVDETFSTEALPQVSVQTQNQVAPQVVTPVTPQPVVTQVAPQTIPHVTTVLISNIETGAVSTSTVTVTWNTNLPSDSQIEYGNSENLGSQTTLDSTLTTSHSVTIGGLTPNTNYIYKVKSKPLGASVATVSSNVEFDTLNHSIPVVAPANIISVSSGSVSTSGATISWTTDKGATSQVEYGTDTTYGSSSADNETLVTSHSISLGELHSGTTYHFRVKSVDEVGNITFSEDYTFTTVGTTTAGVTSGISTNVPASSTAPLITNEAPTPIVDATGVDGEVVFEINDGNPNTHEDVVIKRDGQVIYEGNSETFTDTNLSNGQTQNYTVYARSSGGSSSGHVDISVAARAGVKQVQFNESGSLASSTPVLHFVKTWKKGDKDIEIEHLQELLAADKDSYPEKYVTGYFGSLTEAALKRFQSKHRLPQTGMVDAATQKELNTVSLSETKLEIPIDFVVFDTDLKRGDQGDAVKNLQQYLIYEGSYKEAIISSYFGNYTHKAIKIFQGKYSISPVSGIVSYKTRHKMQQLVGL